MLVDLVAHGVPMEGRQTISHGRPTFARLGWKAAMQPAGQGDAMEFSRALPTRRPRPTTMYL